MLQEQKGYEQTGTYYWVLQFKGMGGGGIKWNSDQTLLRTEHGNL